MHERSKARSTGIRPCFRYRVDADGARMRTSQAARQRAVCAAFHRGGRRASIGVTTAGPTRPLHETDIYELHVKGFTARMPEVPPELRGTYAGLAHPAAINT